jgi:hypothetical protein
MQVEYWVMKVLLHRPTGRRVLVQELSPRDVVTYLANVESGSMSCLQDGTIVEPVEHFKPEEEATAERERRLRDDPKGDYRVILTTKLDNGERV